MVPDRDYFACADDEIADTTSDLTMVGGKVVYGAGDFAALDDGSAAAGHAGLVAGPHFGGYGAWGDRTPARTAARRRRLAMSAAAARTPATSTATIMPLAWSKRLPIDDLKSFWGALGCACWAV